MLLSISFPAFAMTENKQRQRKLAEAAELSGCEERTLAQVHQFSHIWDIAGLAELYMGTNLGSLWPDSHLAVFSEVEPRSDVEIFDLRPIAHQSDHRQKSTTKTFDALRRVLDYLYESYAKQGPARRSLSLLARKQDREDMGRVIHFMLYDPVITLAGLIREAVSQGTYQVPELPYGHMQILLSRSPEEKLHVEDLITIDRYPGEVIADGGRFSFPPLPKDHPARSDASFQKFSKQVLFIRILQWCLYEYPVQRLFVQLNRAVEVIFKRLGFPIDQVKQHIIEETYQTDNGPELGEEIILEMDRQTMAFVENRLLVLNLILQPERAVSLSHSQEDFHLRLGFGHRQIPSLLNLGILGFSNDQNHSAWPLRRDRPIPSEVATMRVLPSNYRPQEVTEERIGSGAFSANYLAYQFPFAYRNLSQLRIDEISRKPPFFLLEKSRIGRIERLVLEIPDGELQAILSWLKVYSKAWLDRRP